MKARLFLLGLAALLAAACDDGPDQSSSTTQSDGGSAGAGVSYGGGGGGDVSLSGGSPSTIADHYKTALDRIKRQDWDGARAELLDALEHSSGQEIQKDIQEHLKLVEQGLLTQPAFSVDEAFAGASRMFEKHVSLRGRLIPGGEVGKVSDYFYLQGARPIQCRYQGLPLADKKKIVLVKEGAQVLVRGRMKAPWGNNPYPYIDATYFRLERLSDEQQAEQDRLKREGPR